MKIFLNTKNTIFYNLSTSIKLIQHLMQQITLKLHKLVNKIIFCINIVKHHFGQCQKQYCQFKAKFLYHKVGTYGDFFHRFEVCTFVFLYTKNDKNRTTGIRDFSV